MPDINALLSAIEAEEQNAFGREEDELTSDRAKALDYYLGRPLGNEVDGRSQVVSKDVMDTIEWIKPSIIRIFTASDSVVTFEPTGPEDVAAAQQESDYVNYILTQKNNWFQIFYEWLTDALLTRNAYALAYWHEDVDNTIESYTGLSDDQMAMVSQEVMTGGLEIIAHSQYPAALPPQPVPDPATGMVQMVQPQAHDIQLRKTKTTGYVKACVLPPERCLVSERARSMSVNESSFFEYWDMKTLTELREMGLDVPDDIRDDGGTELGTADLARNVGRLTAMESRNDRSDPAMRIVRVRMVWVRFDYNQDGLAEVVYCILVGRQILHMEEVETIPVACIVPKIMPHRHIGLSIYDDIMDLQEIKTALIRQMLDNLYLANNGRYGVSDKVNLEDMLTSRPGGMVRVNGIPSQEIFPFVHPQMMGPALQGIEYIDQIRENRTGTNRYFTGTDQRSLNKTASGIAQLTSAASQRVELIARVVADGVRELFQIVHELTLKHSNQPEVIQLRNTWVTVDPRQWKKRKDMRIGVGLGIGNREQMMGNLQLILQMMGPAIQLGVATPLNYYNALSELTKAAGFPSPDKFFTDPAKAPPQPKQPPPEIIKAQMDNQTRLQISNQDNVVDLEKQRREQQFEAAMKIAEISQAEREAKAAE